MRRRFALPVLACFLLIAQSCLSASADGAGLSAQTVGALAESGSGVNGAVASTAPSSPADSGVAFPGATLSPASATLVPGSFPPIEMPPPAEFAEIWAYVQSGEEASLDPAWPITDVGHFGAMIGNTGKLKGLPVRKKLSHYNGRVHLVIAEISSYALTHFCLDPDYPIRARLLTDIVVAAKGYDGVQIDFETVLQEDTEHYLSFLSSLKKRLGKKTLSVAIPARTRKVIEPYEYRRVAAVADRVVVMAYDEHWSGSAPGSVASSAWCSKVSAYALSTIGERKLVMGLPFYGRAWGETNPSRAYRFSTLSKLMDEKDISEINRVDGSASFEYQETIRVRVFFEDARSVRERALLYSGSGVGKIAFWRVGQEDPDVWNCLALTTKR